MLNRHRCPKPMCGAVYIFSSSGPRCIMVLHIALMEPGEGMLSLNISFPQIPHIAHFVFWGDMAILCLDSWIATCEIIATPIPKNM
jgi:hypothetical protein